MSCEVFGTCSAHSSVHACSWGHDPPLHHLQVPIPQGCAAHCPTPLSGSSCWSPCQAVISPQRGHTQRAAKLGLAQAASEVGGILAVAAAKRAPARHLHA